VCLCTVKTKKATRHHPQYTHYIEEQKINQHQHGASKRVSRSLSEAKGLGWLEESTVGMVLGFWHDAGLCF
jgi:hypothetical protein